MSDNIKVVVKVRPLIAREIEEKLSYNWSVRDNTLIQIDKNGKVLKDNLQQFTFDKVYDKDSDTIALYDDIVKPIVGASLKGINGTIFAYGQTSSGKTYTMAGTENVPGITQLAVHDLFEMIKNIPERDFLLRVSYIELYNETINDLLDVNKTNIKIHDSLQGTKVDCTEKVTSTPLEMFDLMKEGEANRQIGTTNMNEKSSRSHSIFQIIIESREHSEEGGEEGCVCMSQLNLVDLAGSERGGQSGATGKCLKESTHINKSLSTLALVIKQLSEDSGCFANYRDSKLTRMLQNSLGGNANTGIICAVTPASLDETISTLQFATRAKVVRNKPKVNEVHTSTSMIQKLTKDLAKMRSKLESAQHIKRDNILLRNKIEQLQRKILNGPRSASQSDRRKTWCAPRRATICTLQPVPEHAMSLAQLSDFIPITDPIAPMNQVKVTVNDEVIEIDSDEELPPEPTQPCSPYHRCKESSKTPPCVLREKVRNAEKAYNDVVEMTKLEKICSPSIVELEQQLQKNNNTITMLDDKVKSLNDECQYKDGVICQLNSDLEKKSNEIQQIIFARDELKKQNDLYDRTVAELEFSYETLKKKSKSREEELLLMLKEKESHFKPKTNDATVLVNFMDLSKDITLVTSDNENSIIDNNDKYEKTLAENAETESRNKILVVQELENKILVYQKQLSNLEMENNVLLSTIDTLNSTIKTQKESIQRIENDIVSYNDVIHQLQLQLNVKEIESDNMTIKSMLTIEDKIIYNNENLNKFVTFFKKHIDVRDMEITDLKQKNNTFNNYRDTNIEYKIKFEQKEKELKKIEVELIDLKDHILETENKITLLRDENDKILLRETKIKEKYSVIKENNKLLESEISKITTGKDKEIVDLRNKYESYIMSSTKKENDLTNDIQNLSEQIIVLNKIINDLRNENNNKEAAELIEKNKTQDVISKLNAFTVQCKDILFKITNFSIEVSDKEDVFNTVQFLLTSIDLAITDELGKRNNSLEYNEKLKRDIANLSEQNINLTKIGENRDQVIDKLEHQLQHSNIELLDMKSIVESKCQENFDISNQLKNKTLIISMLVEKDNKINEEIDKIKNLLSSKDEKYQKIKVRLEKSILAIKNIRVHLKSREKCDSLQESVKNLNQEIYELTYDSAVLREKLVEISKQSSILQNNLDQKNRVLSYVYNKVYNLNLHQIPSSDKAADFADLPSLIDNCVKVFTTVEINQDSYRNEFNVKAKDLKNHNKLLEEKLAMSTKENLSLSITIQNMKKEIISKKEEFNNLIDITNNLKSDLQRIKEENIENNKYCQKLKCDVNLLKNKLLDSENKYLKTRINDSISESVHTGFITPLPLLTMCHNKINEIICCEALVAKFERKLHIDEIKSDNVQTNGLDYVTLNSHIETLNNENLALKIELNKLVNSNSMLYTDLEQSRQETKSLIDLTQELDKIIQNHRTNLTTLTATNYAENNLLKVKIKAHLHHHNRLHNVCERDIPELKKQLVQLHSLLQNETTPLSSNNSFKRFSWPNVLPGNTSMSIKNESNMTLDGDLLMLDTNVTMTTDNTSTVCDEISFDITQINVENISTLIQELDSDKISEINIIKNYEHLDSTLVGCENCKAQFDLKEDSQIKTKEIEALQQNLIKVTKEKEESYAQCEMFLSEIKEYKNNIDEMTAKVMKVKQEKIEFENKYNNVASELILSKDLLQKAKHFEKDIECKSEKIDILKKNLTDKNKEMKKLQDENTTMSSELMDYISEIDTLKKEVDEFKLNQNKLNEKNRTCFSCEVKDKLLQSLKKEFSHKENANSSSHDIYCLLQSEIIASQEDCKGIAEEVATIKTRLEQNNSTLNQSMDLDDDIRDVSLREYRVMDNDIQKLEIKPMQDNGTDYYTIEKEKCLEFMMQKTGEDKVNLCKNNKIVEIMKTLYDFIVNKHGTEIENLSNKLTNIQEANTNLLLKIDDHSLKNNELCKEIEDKNKIINNFSKVIENLKLKVDTIKENISSHTEYKCSSDVSNLFKDSILSIFDEEFNLLTASAYDLIISNITAINKMEINKVVTQCNTEQEKVQNLYEELNKVNNELNQIKMQFSEKECEYQLLKSQEHKIKEICRNVNLDLIVKEKEMKDTINEGVKTLLSDGYIDIINLETSTAMDSINILFKYLTEKSKSDVHNTKQLLNENHQLVEQLQLANDNLQQNEHHLSEQKIAHEKVIADFETKLQHLDTIIIKNLNEKVDSLHKTNVKYEDIINKLNEQVSVIQTKLNSETKKEIETFISKVKTLEDENCRLKEINDIIIKEKDNVQCKLQDACTALKQREIEYTKLSNELDTLKESLFEKSALIQQLKSEAERLLESNNRVMSENKELVDKVGIVQDDFKKRCEEVQQLQLNTKTLEKSAELQNNIIKRIQKEKEEQAVLLSKKDERIQNLCDELSALRQLYDSAAEVKEARLEDHAVVKSEPKRQSGSKTEEFLARSRERRRSIYDANRSLSTPNHEADIEAVFAKGNDLGDLFSVKNEPDSGRNTPDSLTISSNAQNYKEEEPDSNVSLSRRRRQSIHDLHRPALRNSFGNSSIKKSTSLRNSTEGNNGETNDSLCAELESCRKELAELRDRCRELDEECETCAQHLDQRNEQCYTLNAEKLALQSRVEEMTEQLKQYTARDKRDVTKAHVAVNTDEDWSSLHTVFVDRMSFDKEVDRNKQLTRALEDFHHKNRELKAAVSSLERKLLRETNASEVTKLRQELDKSRKHLEQLSARSQEADYLRTRCDQMQEHIKELTATLETCKRNQDSGDRRQDDKKSLEIAGLKKKLEALSKEKGKMTDAGSAIVMSQQVSDVMRENQKLIRKNTKLMNLCKRRGLLSDDDRENQLPNL